MTVVFGQPSLTGGSCPPPPPARRGSAISLFGFRNTVNAPKVLAIGAIQVCLIADLKSWMIRAFFRTIVSFWASAAVFCTEQGFGLALLADPRRSNAASFGLGCHERASDA